MGAGLINIFVSGIAQCIHGRKLLGVANFLALPVVLLLIVGGMASLALNDLFSDEPDNFGKDIVIPADMKISDPVETFDETNGSATDELTQSIVAAFSGTNPATAGTKPPTDLAVLNEFGTTNREKLIRYLASSPQWFVTEEQGQAYAYRRLVINGRWQNQLNGYFTDFEVAHSPASHFQTRIVIGFDGPVFAEPFRKEATVAKVDAKAVTIKVVNEDFNQGKGSYFILESSRAALEVYEQSGIAARPITQLAIADVKRELEAALASSNSTASASHPGDPEIQLAKGMEGGIYQVRAFVNPGESGKVYIKVFEATRNTPLSADRIKPVSMSRIGWSTNSKETFRYQSQITVYEGDWGTFYPGRFELWFVPDTGGPERKLIDRIFRIEGWMR